MPSQWSEFETQDLLDFALYFNKYQKYIYQSDFKSNFTTVVGGIQSQINTNMVCSSLISYDTNVTYSIYYTINNKIPKGGLFVINLPP